MINHKRIKSSLKSILREMPDHNQKTLDEIGLGYASVGIRLRPWP